MCTVCTVDDKVRVISFRCDNRVRGRVVGQVLGSLNGCMRRRQALGFFGGGGDQELCMHHACKAIDGSDFGVRSVGGMEDGRC